MTTNKSGLTAGRPSRSAGSPTTTAAILAGKSKAGRVNFQVTPELHAAFKSAVAAAGETMKDVLTTYMERYVAGDR